MIRNLTIQNLTPQGGSQAEALRLEGCDKCVVRDATIISLQDTLLWSGQIYASELPDRGQRRLHLGDGRGVLRRTARSSTLGRTGYIVQARNPASATATCSSIRS